jgi:GNAT superfamily N-acetyltransferase
MPQSLVRQCNESDFDTVWMIINDGARAYRGHVPPELLHDPYMSQNELRAEMADGVEFWGNESDGILLGVMGIQDVGDGTLIRHAYVRSARQGEGIGSRLLAYLRSKAQRPVLIGTWANAGWAIGFYRRHGFRIVSPEQKARLIRRYWKVPNRQMEASVVLADEQWMQSGNDSHSI